MQDESWREEERQRTAAALLEITARTQHVAAAGRALLEALAKGTSESLGQICSFKGFPTRINGATCTGLEGENWLVISTAVYCTITQSQTESSKNGRRVYRKMYSLCYP